ncbi:MarR family transcriptional regulator [Sneathiella chungangensis]|uniref:MarR family transcriptional regulator n=1 Tax=Sneathiella chungangensis TaxID=1418234 RepID=A0A845MBC4_9PROT|nr:MarR family winged helix-turn-helix transcriptional regulator [Sneathiella chungangensis]MZR20756.1 MarR family transcriptional regulator [Sneathiella chungangensis]
MVEDFVRGKGYLTLGTRFKRIGDRLQADVQQLIDAAGLAVQTGQYPLLAALDEMGPMTIGDLAAALGVSQPGVTRSVGQLAKQGVVTVRRGSRDQRKRRVELTEKGRTLVADGRQTIWPLIETHLADICADTDGPLLDQLDALETRLQEKSLYSRVMETKEGNTNE